MEIEAGMNMENLTIIVAAAAKLLSFWWPVIVFGIIGIAYSDRQVAKMKNNEGHPE